MFKSSKKIIISGAIGNALEMYDYIIWGLFAAFLSAEFLPPNSSLSDIFFLFFITYILRPIGGFLGGMLADQAGRKRVLTLSILLMGIGTAAIGILPSYEQIGVTSVFLLLFIRLVQVISVSNEYISSVSLLIESCEKQKKGYLGSWAAFGVNAGMLLSSLTGTLILYLIDRHILPPWGWRLAFVFAFVTMLLGFWIRNSIPESQEFITNHARSNTRSLGDIFFETLRMLKQHLLESLVVFMLVVFGVTTTVLIFVHAPSHMIKVNNFSSTQAFMINSAGLAIATALIPTMGRLSDAYGRIRVISTGIVALTLFITPHFISLTSGTFSHVLWSHCLMAIPCAAIFAVIPVFITDIFPHSVRCSSANLIYSVASCVGGGAMPWVAVKLSEHYNYSQSYILVVFGVLGLIILAAYYKKIPHESSLFSLIK